MAKVTVYTKEPCGYCRAAKALLSERGIPFEEVKISPTDDAQWKALMMRSGMRTVPQIFAGDRLIGGFTELSKLDQEDGLTSLK